MAGPPVSGKVVDVVVLWMSRKTLVREKWFVDRSPSRAAPSPLVHTGACPAYKHAGERVPVFSARCFARSCQAAPGVPRCPCSCARVDHHGWIDQSCSVALPHNLLQVPQEFISQAWIRPGHCQGPGAERLTGSWAGETRDHTIAGQLGKLGSRPRSNVRSRSRGRVSVCAQGPATALSFALLPQTTHPHKYVRYPPSWLSQGPVKRTRFDKHIIKRVSSS
jgi:hypothetical protein